MCVRVCKLFIMQSHVGGVCSPASQTEAGWGRHTPAWLKKGEREWMFMLVWKHLYMIYTFLKKMIFPHSQRVSVCIRSVLRAALHVRVGESTQRRWSALLHCSTSCPSRGRRRPPPPGHSSKVTAGQSSPSAYAAAARVNLQTPHQICRLLEQRDAGEHTGAGDDRTRAPLAR